jgi:hypothetical protein
VPTGIGLPHLEIVRPIVITGLGVRIHHRGFLSCCNRVENQRSDSDAIGLAISQFATVLIETVPAHWDEIQVDSGSTTPTWGESPHSLPVSAVAAEASMWSWSPIRPEVVGFRDAASGGLRVSRALAKRVGTALTRSRGRRGLGGPGQDWG